MSENTKALRVTREIDVDFYSQEYILVNAKQYDRIARYLKITCYNQGELVALDSTKYKAYIRYRKADDLGVFNTCAITDDGKVVVTLTDQMLATAGICCGDLVIYKIDDVTTEVVAPTESIYTPDDNVTVLATMTFYINVKAAAFDDAEIESSNEFKALSEALSIAMTEYTSVINASAGFASDAETSALAAKASEVNAKTSETNASTSETNAENSASLAESWAIGGTGKRDGEDTNNSKYYCNIAIENADSAKQTLQDSKATFVPMGTITSINDLPASPEVGHMYCIETGFTSTNAFRTPNKSYAPGTFVYRTSDGKWDCFEVSLEAIDAIAVNEFKTYLGIS